MSRHLAGAVLMSVLLLIYLGFALVYASVLLRDDNVVVNAMGISLLVLPLLGAWGLFVEWRFGVQSSKLRALLDQSGEIPDFELTPTGRPVKADALERFPEFQAEVESHPDHWQSWFRLGLAYDACGDRRRARWAVRRAIQLERS